MTTVVHQFKLQRGPNGDTYILAVADTGPPETVAICPKRRWARQIQLGLSYVEGRRGVRERKQAAKERRKRRGSIPGC